MEIKGKNKFAKIFKKVLYFLNYSVKIVKNKTKGDFKMKKTLTIALLFVLVVMMATTVKATATDDLVAFLSKTFTIAGENVSLSSADKVKVERYLEENPVTESEAEAIKAKVNETVDYLNEIGVTDPAKLTTEQKDKVVSLVNEAAAVIDLTVSYNATDKVVSIYKDGKQIDSINFSDTLATTGGNNVAYIIVPAVAIIAIAAAFALRKVNE